MQRLFLTEDLAVGDQIDLGREQSHYLSTVLRMVEGRQLLVFNGRDGEWLAEIVSAGRKSIRLILREQTRAQTPEGAILYCFAPIKQGRLDYMVQKAVEMGAGALQPVLTQHTQVSKVGIERLQSNVIEAAEQCGILSIPPVRETVKLEKFLADWDADRTLVFCDEAAVGNNPMEQLMGLKGHKLGLLIGPEGGFSDGERTLLRALPFVLTIPLGPRILRADTAAVAALTLMQATAGDWQNHDA